MRENVSSYDPLIMGRTRLYLEFQKTKIFAFRVVRSGRDKDVRNNRTSKTCLGYFRNFLYKGFGTIESNFKQTFL